jgi:hypothetical protein
MSKKNEKIMYEEKVDKDICSLKQNKPQILHMSKKNGKII